MEDIEVGDTVIKVSGEHGDDEGKVVAKFYTPNGSARFVVELPAKRGVYYMIYAVKDVRLVRKKAASVKSDCPKCGKMLRAWAVPDSTGHEYVPAWACIDFAGGKCDYHRLFPRPVVDKPEKPVFDPKRLP